MVKEVSIMDYLRDAIENGEMIKVIYHGGSTPGQIRELIPRAIEGKTLKAICVTTDSAWVKSFSITKIEPTETALTIIPLEEPKEEPPKPIYVNIEAFLNEKYQDLSKLGWQPFGHADFDDETITGITLHEVFKNGSPKKRFSICLLQLDRPYLPYYVKSPNLPIAKTFKTLDAAFPLFLEQAELLSPNRVKNNERKKANHR